MEAWEAASFAVLAAAGGDALDPVRANLLLAREIAYPGLRLDQALRDLSALAESAAAAVGPGGSAPERAAALARFLHHTAGFRGNRAEYADPRNSYLHEVLHRRLGIPISLAVVYITIARSLGLQAFGVGLPGHFLVGVGSDGWPFLVDAFSGEAGLTARQCRALVRNATGSSGALDPSWLRPAAGRSIVTRMLHNLRQSYAGREDWGPAIRVVERLTELDPDEAGHQRDLGLLHSRVKDLPRAARHLGEYLARAPGASDAAVIRRSRNLMLEELARLN